MSKTGGPKYFGCVKSFTLQAEGPAPLRAFVHVALVSFGARFFERRSRLMGIRLLVAGAAASVVVLSGVSVAAITGLLPDPSAAKAPAQTVAAPPPACGHCGVVVGIRAVEVEGKYGRDAGTTKRYHIEVRMEDGSLRTISTSAPPAWKAGDPVHVRGGRLAIAS